MITKKPTHDTFHDYGKLPPQDTEAERAVLAACMIETGVFETVFRTIKSGECFYKDDHARIYNAMISLFDEKVAIDTLTLTDRLRSTGELESVGGAYALTVICNSIGSTAHVAAHAAIIKECWVRREAIRVSAQVIRDSYNSESDCFDVLDDAMRSLGTVLTDVRSGAQKDWMGEVDNYNRQLLEIKNRPQSDRYILGLRSGLYPVDRKTLGLNKGDLIILAGRPSEGKTTFALQAIRENAKAGIPVGLISLEMSVSQLIAKIISMESGIDMERIRTATLTHEEWDIYQMAKDQVRKWPIFVEDKSGMTPSEISAIATDWKSKHGIQMLMVDYIQLCTGSNSKTINNREQEVSAISRNLKVTARDLGIPVLALSQLSRAMESRSASDKRPMLSDLRESGSLEQDADVVIFIFRPEKHGILRDENGNSTEGLAEFIVAKNRLGALGIIRAQFDGPTNKFYDYNTSYPNSYSVDKTHEPQKNYEEETPF